MLPQSDCQTGSLLPALYPPFIQLQAGKIFFSEGLLHLPALVIKWRLKLARSFTNGAQKSPR
jgi:hypothetical protein